MSDELCDPKPDFSTVVVSDLIVFFSSIFSNPLYLSYFIFFSPYLIKLASFLSPLLIPVLILLLSDIAREKDYLGSGDDDLGLYEVLFETRSTNCLTEENPPEKASEENQEPAGPVSEVKIKALPVVEERRLENFLKILDRFERMSSIDDKPAVVPVRQNAATKTGANGAVVSSNADRVDGVRRKAETKTIPSDDIKVKTQSQRVTTISSDVDDRADGVRKEPGNNLKAESFRTWDRNSSSNSSSFGSMRVEKEWKRTLACKLFEERHNVDGGEGMDSLWEAYEKDYSTKPLLRGTSEKKKRNKKTSEVEFNMARHGSDREEEDGDEDEVVGGQLCCLHAIKLSTGKLNLGMGRPNLVKISKAIRGFGWLHHVGKHSKKVHNNNGDRY